MLRVAQHDIFMVVRILTQSQGGRKLVAYVIPSSPNLALISLGSIPRSLLRSAKISSSQSPSFPHAFSGNPGETLTGPPIKTFGGDNCRKNHQKGLSIPRSLLRGSSFPNNSGFHSLLNRYSPSSLSSLSLRLADQFGNRFHVKVIRLPLGNVFHSGVEPIARRNVVLRDIHS